MLLSAPEKGQPTQRRDHGVFWKWKWIEMSRNGGIASPPSPSRSWPFESPARVVEMSPSIASRGRFADHVQPSQQRHSLESSFRIFQFHLHPLQGEKHEEIHRLELPPFSSHVISPLWALALAGGAKIGAHAHPQVHPTKLALASSPVALRSSFFPLESGGSGSGSMVIRAAHASLQQ